MNQCVGERFRLKKRIGAGSFGEIYIGEDLQTHEEVAVKLEAVHVHPSQLGMESRAYRILADGTGIPKLHWFGTDNDYNILVIDLLGRSIEDLFVSCHHKFSLKTVLMLADQLISRIEFIHSKGILHRDVKPDNFVIGLHSKSNQIFVVDYGLSKSWKDSRNMHISFREGKPLTGTARYSSINTHLGREQSRRDDLESLGYMLVYFLKGSLPWMGTGVDHRKQRYEVIAEKKMSTTVDVLCKGLPQEFATYLSEVRKLEFTETPNYARYRHMFRDLFIKEGYVYDYKYDWSQRIPSAQSAPQFSIGKSEERSQCQQQQKAIFCPNIPRQLSAVRVPPARLEVARNAGSTRMQNTRILTSCQPRRLTLGLP